MGANGKHKWFPFGSHRSSSTAPPPVQHQRQEAESPSKDFICPISGSIMSDPVIVSTGQTFDHISVQACRNLNFIPDLEDGTRPDFTNVIPNKAMKSTIIRWCQNSGINIPRLDISTVESIVRLQISSATNSSNSVRNLLRSMPESPVPGAYHAETEVYGRRDRNFSNESEIQKPIPSTPLPLTTKPVCLETQVSSSSVSSSSINSEILNQYHVSSESSTEEEEFYNKLMSVDVILQEQGVISLRRMTRNKEDSRVSLCTPRILSALRSLIESSHRLLQTEAIASLVNLSIEKQNKVTIVRSGFIPQLIEILRSGSTEAQELATGAMFSLALEEDNKMAIGVLGGLYPLLHVLCSSENERTRHDSALALYQLSLIQSNRTKLVRLGAVQALLPMVKSSEASASRVLLVLCNLAACSEGRSAMLDGNAVEILVEKLNDREPDSEATQENCVAALLALSHGNLRFKGLAKEARAMDILREIEENGSVRARDKAKKILQVMKGRENEDDDDDATDMDSIFDSNGLSRTRYRVGRHGGLQNSTNF